MPERQRRRRQDVDEELHTCSFWCRPICNSAFLICHSSLVGKAATTLLEVQLVVVVAVVEVLVALVVEVQVVVLALVGVEVQVVVLALVEG